MYLDPGFGSMVIQLVVAFIAACGAYLVLARKKISAAFSRKKQDKKIETENCIRE